MEIGYCESDLGLDLDLGSVLGLDNNNDNVKIIRSCKMCEMVRVRAQKHDVDVALQTWELYWYWLYTFYLFVNNTQCWRREKLGQNKQETEITAINNTMGGHLFAATK